MSQMCMGISGSCKVLAPHEVSSLLCVHQACVLTNASGALTIAMPSVLGISVLLICLLVRAPKQFCSADSFIVLCFLILLLVRRVRGDPAAG